MKSFKANSFRTISSLSLVICFVVALSSCGANHKETVKEQADLMGKSLIDKDFKTFVKFVHPKIAEMSGGEANMLTEMENSTAQMDASGVKLLSFTFGEPSEIVTVGEELQCAIPETIQMQMAEGKVTSKSTVIATSTDEGKNWFFFDTAGMTTEQVKEIFPTLSSDIVIPPFEKPVFEKGN